MSTRQIMILPNWNYQKQIHLANIAVLNVVKDIVNVIKIGDAFFGFSYWLHSV